KVGGGVCRSIGFLLAGHFASDLVPQGMQPSRLCCPWGVSRDVEDNRLAPNHTLRPWSKSGPPEFHRGDRLSTAETRSTGRWQGESPPPQNPVRSCIRHGGNA